MNFGAHKVLISTSGNQCSSRGANIVACCTFSTVCRRKTSAGVAVSVSVFFHPPRVLAAGGSKDGSGWGWGLAGPSLCWVHYFRHEESLGQPVCPRPGHRKPFGITPTFRSSCWQARGVTSDAFHTSLIFGKQDLLSGTCWQGRPLSSRVH